MSVSSNLVQPKWRRVHSRGCPGSLGPQRLRVITAPVFGLRVIRILGPRPGNYDRARQTSDKRPTDVRQSTSDRVRQDRQSLATTTDTLGALIEHTTNGQESTLLEGEHLLTHSQTLRLDGC